jgi:DNA-binding transcriptional LysR family regulator
MARIRMINRTSEEVRSIFETGGIDLAIAEWPIHIPDINLKRYKVPCVAVVPSTHPLAEKQIITPADLDGLSLIGMPVTRLIGHQIQNAFVECDVNFTPVIESEYFSSMCALAATGCGIGIVDRWSAEMFRPLGLAVRTFQPTILYEIGVFTRPNLSATPILDEFLALLDQRLTTQHSETTTQGIV